MTAATLTTPPATVGGVTETRYFVDEKFATPTLLRRSPDFRDEALIEGTWQATTEVIEYMAGNNDFVTEISEAEAQRREPAAFA